jgi:hypothetical protein
MYTAIFSFHIEIFSGYLCLHAQRGYCVFMFGNVDSDLSGHFLLWRQKIMMMREIIMNGNGSPQVIINIQSVGQNGQNMKMVCK